MRMTWLALLLVCGCGAASYGVSSAGVFPPRPATADYPNWEHHCVTVTKSTAGGVLNDAGQKGWQLVDLVTVGGSDLMCFKRPVAATVSN